MLAATSNVIAKAPRDWGLQRHPGIGVLGLGFEICSERLVSGACNAIFLEVVIFVTHKLHKAPRGFEPQSLDSGSRVLAVAPRSQK